MEPPIFTVDISQMSCNMHSVHSLEVVSVALEAGPENLLVAKFPGDIVHTTELSNLMLKVAPKKKEKEVLKKPAMKKPGAAPVAVADVPAPVAVAEVAAPAAVVAAPEGEERDYAIMYYSKSNTIGIRAKLGLKNQVLCFGKTSCTKSKAQMKAVGGHSCIV